MLTSLGCILSAYMLLLYVLQLLLFGFSVESTINDRCVFQMKMILEHDATARLV